MKSCASLTLLFVCIAAPALCWSQPGAGRVGISVQFQNPQVDFTIPIWVHDRVSLAPAFGLKSISDNSTDLALGVIARIYLSGEQFAPFCGGRFGALLLIPKDSDTITDYVLGALFGGEYFFNKHVSAGAELQLNAAFSGEFSNRFGNPNGTNISTATALFASFYF